MPKDENYQTDSRALRADIRDARLMHILRKYSLVLPRNAMEWRTPPEETLGTLRGLNTETLQLLCTDGVVCWFLGHSSRRLLFGHLENFESDKPLHRLFKPGAGKSKEQRTAEKVAALLALLDL